MEQEGGRKKLDCHTVPELRALAKKRGVSLKGATKKSDIIAKLRVGKSKK